MLSVLCVHCSISSGLNFEWVIFITTARRVKTKEYDEEKEEEEQQQQQQEQEQEHEQQ